ncbi:hypothetical protein [Paraburkholderia rhizosphaerae]|uniref:Uncharacterized protein n=1 Tax=Paraburkholderia rhizosphaerae TaxID=480658 RepID=A0A4V3HE28_9BURK|nr:hypothetical protein [Paraburkholderia rhizosphaerae]TDY43853.1 hypothetical protein BX592_11755 [Paraburkholderia rhizosphaerae]
MSTKASIKWRDKTADQPGFHRYHDVLEELFGGEDETAIYLQLDGVQLQLETICDGHVSVTMELPRETARVLGLLSDAAVESGNIGSLRRSK